MPFAKQVKRRRGTTAENDAFTGAEGEIVVDTERHELRVHDGVTQGGHIIPTNETLDFANKALDNLSQAGEARFAEKANSNMDNITSIGKEKVVSWGMPDTTAGVNIGGNNTYTFPTNGWLMITTNVASSVQYTSDKYTADQYSPFHYGCACPAGSAFAGMYPVQSGETVTKTYTSGQWKVMFYPNKGV